MENALSWKFMPATEFPSISREWQQLCNRSLRSPLLSADFIEVALRHFGRGDEMICFAETATGTVAATILQRKNYLVWDSFQPSQMPLGSWLQLRELDFPAMLKSLLHTLPLPTVMLAVTNLDSRFWPRPKGEALLTVDAITTGEIELPDSSEEFMQSLNCKPFNRRMRKAEREIGPLSLTTQTEADAVDAYVNLYASMECRGWKGASGTALAPNNGQTKFYADLLRRFAATGRARMFTLKMGARDVAAQMAIAEDDVLYLLKTTYEPELRSLGPGVLLQYFITLYGYAHEPRIKHIEFYGPLNESQKMWITGSRPIYHLNTYRSNLFTGPHRYLIDRRARSKPTIESSH
jgi:CelD/BcsL family acetyltransferase involved in cellulose biosynthesis